MTLPKVLRGILDTLNSPLYRYLLETSAMHCNNGPRGILDILNSPKTLIQSPPVFTNSKPNYHALAYAQLLFGPYTVPNFKHFLQTGSIQIAPVQALSDYFVTDVCSEITALLQHRQATPAYSPTQF